MDTAVSLACGAAVIVGGWQGEHEVAGLYAIALVLLYRLPMKRQT